MRVTPADVRRVEGRNTLEHALDAWARARARRDEDAADELWDEAKHAQRATGVDADEFDELAEEALARHGLGGGAGVGAGMRGLGASLMRGLGFWRR